MKKFLCFFVILSFAFAFFAETSSEVPSNYGDLFSESDDEESAQTVNLYELPEKETGSGESGTESAGSGAESVESGAEVSAGDAESAGGEEVSESDAASTGSAEVTASADADTAESTYSEENAITDPAAGTTESATTTTDSAASKIAASKSGVSEVPAAKRPKPADKEKAEKAAEKDDSEDTADEYIKTIRYGIPSEIADLIDKLIKNDDPRFSDEIYDVFQVTQNPSVKEKIIKYFTQMEDPCIEDFAVNLLNDPYDEKNDVVNATFKYVSAVKTEAAIPAVLTLIESENEKYFNSAVDCIGEIGGPAEAVFLVEYLDRDDLSDAQRQSLMRTCGKMHALETWDKLVEILEDEDENTYVRMYAAEAIGLMEKKESVPVLVSQFSSTDPNLRQYIIKGLKNFPDVVEAKETILQGIRDEHWRVRQESIKTAGEIGLTDAVPYLTYRIKNDSEKLIKEESISALAHLNTSEGNDFLIEQLQDKKTGDATKKKIVECLLKEGNGEKEILELADTCLKDDKRKDLRYAIGKELAKYENPAFEDICLEYLESKDTTTISLGIDIYKTNKFSSAESKMRALYAERKTNSSIKSRIKKMLNIEDEEDSK